MLVKMREMLRMTRAGVLLCLAMLLASEDHLLRLYNLVLPGMALILTNFVVTQRFLESTCNAQPPPTLPTDFWSQLLSYLSVDNTAAVDAADVSCDNYHKMFLMASVMIQLVLAGGFVSFITVSSGKVERVALAFFANLFVYPCCLQLVGASKSDVNLANTLVCRVVGGGMELWSSLCLERMLYTSVLSMTRNDIGLGWVLVAVWYRTRCPLFVSWLVAYAAQFVDSLLATDVSDLSCVEVMLFNLHQRSWTPMMYLGLCSVAGYLTDVVWKLVYLAVAREPARRSVTDNGLSEALTLIHARVVCFFISISTADMFSFAIPFLVALLTVRWIFRAVKSLLLSDDSRTRVSACVAYVVTIIALPALVAISLFGEKRIYLAGNLFIALRFSIKGTSTLVQSFVRRWYSTADVDNAEEVNLTVKVSQ